MRIRRVSRQSLVMVLAFAAACWLVPRLALGQNLFMVSSCPGQGRLPVRFQVDCSHLTDPASKQLCRPFIENQACKVFPAYRKITGIKLEDKCTSILFTIYQDSNWPHPKGEGGLALNCAVDYLEQYSVKFRKDSKIGPYDVHELLHEYQLTLGPLPSVHPLFSSGMAEATRAVGDDEQYQTDIICARFVLFFCQRRTPHHDTYEVPTRKSFLYSCMPHSGVGSVCTIRIPALCGCWWKHLRNDKGSDGWSDSRCNGYSHERVAPH